MSRRRVADHGTSSGQRNSTGMLFHW
jgi:hypothetical protein